MKNLSPPNNGSLLSSPPNIIISIRATLPVIDFDSGFNAVPCAEPTGEQFTGFHYVGRVLHPDSGGPTVGSRPVCLKKYISGPAAGRGIPSNLMKTSAQALMFIILFVALFTRSSIAAPYVDTFSPARSTIGVPVSNRTVSFHVKDAGSGVVIATGWAMIGGDNVNCSSATVSCTGTSADLTFTYARTTDWDNNATVTVLVGGFKDVGGNAIEPTSSIFHTEYQPGQTRQTAARTKAEVLAYLASLPSRSSKRTLSGQFIGWCGGEDSTLFDRIHASAARYPAVMSGNYANFGCTTAADLISNTNAYLKVHWAAGGLVEVGWHADNPVTMSWNNSTSVNFIDLVTNGTTTNTNWKTLMDRVATALADLRDSGVVVIFRPLHQMNGNWFWWGAKDGTKFKNAWIYTYDYLTTTKGLNNLLWGFAFDWNGGSASTWYPGSSYVDIVGVDYYSSSGNVGVPSNYSYLTGLGKPFAFTEMGQCDPSGSGCTAKDSNLIITGIKANAPATVYWSNWDEVWSLDYHNNVPKLLNDPWVVNREDNPSGKNAAGNITDLSPSWATAGGAAFTLTVDGSNIVSGSKVCWNGSDRTTVFISSTELQATISATDIAASGSATVTVSNPAPGGGISNGLRFDIFPVFTSLTLNPIAVSGGSTSTGTVTLSGPAPTGGSVVSLSSSNTLAAVVPATVTVPAGNASATFTITTLPVSASNSVTISASYGGGTRSATLTVNRPALSSLSRSPSTVVGGNPSTGTVTLSGPAPTGGAVVSLSSSNTSAARVPASLTVPAGSASATFTITTSTVTSSRNVTIRGNYGGVQKTATLVVTVNPPGTDTAPPYVDTRSPASGATGVSRSNRTVSFHVKDSLSGVLQSSITANIEGTNYTCSSSGVVCSGSSSDITFTYTNGSDWSYSQQVDVTVNAGDVAGNAMTAVSWYYTIENAPTPGLLITHVQSAGGSKYDAGHTTHAKAYTTSVTRGNILIAFFALGTPSSITSTCSNTFTAITTLSDIKAYYAFSTSSGSCTVTANHSSQSWTSLWVSEFANVHATSPIDHSAYVKNKVGSSSLDGNTVGPMTTTYDGSMIVAQILNMPGTWPSVSPGTNYTEVVKYSATANPEAEGEIRLQTSAGSISAAWSCGNTDNYSATMIGLRRASTP